MSSGLIDIHQHLVYQMDDGPSTWEKTQAMLAKAEEQGMTHIIATPHAFPGQAPFDYDGFLDKVNAINQYTYKTGMPVVLYPGAEIYYTSKTLKLLEEEEIPTLTMSQYVLVEFSTQISANDLFSAMRELCNGGYRPILAHVERYDCLKEQLVRELRDMGILIQMNAQTVLHSAGLFSGKGYVRRLLKENLVDFVATDAHNTSSRPVCLGDAYDFLTKHYGQEKADWLTWKHQLQVLPILNS